ncbi:MAG: hypothetical protein M3198_18200 [Actinomycetota bacterium]|nr:hypothetical protein [Actinomycetota bacterium]
MLRECRLLVLGIALLLASCGGSDEREAASERARGRAGERQALGAEDVAFGSSLAQIRGHHLASLELYRAGNTTGALVHAGHPIEEILASVRSELQTHYASVAKSLEQALQAPAEHIRQGVSVQALQRTYDRAASVTRLAESSIVGDLARSSEYKASVIAALVGVSEHEYEEAVGEGETVKFLDEYQDAYGFLNEAQKLYVALGSEVQQASPEAADEIGRAFARLNKALPSTRPPDKLTSLPEVQSAAGLIARNLTQALDALPVEEADPDEAAAQIEQLLDQVLTAYSQGEVDRAEELTAEAYLQHYEDIEVAVISKAPDVNDQLEPLLGSELRKKIQEKAPESEIEALVARAKQLLREGLGALKEGARAAS